MPETFNSDLPLELHLQAATDGYRGQFRQQGVPCSEAFPAMQLHEAAVIDRMPASLNTLGRVVDAIVAYWEADLAMLQKALLLCIGCHLFDQVFAGLDSYRRQQIGAEYIDLRIIGDDWIAALPWTLLAHHSHFLCAHRLSVSISQREVKADDVHLLASPEFHVLLIMPQQAGDTQADAHLAEMEHFFKAFHPLLHRKKNLHRVSTWDEFRKVCARYQPEILYYYGHGHITEIGGQRSSRLEFDDGVRPMIDVAGVLRHLPCPPRLAYFNCCLGDTGSELGAGTQLGAMVPAVISNRTFASIEAARKQAVVFWQSLLEKKGRLF